MGKFNATKVTRRPRRGFVQGDYTLELVQAKQGVSSNGTIEVVVHMRIVGSEVGYNNARVFEHLYFNDAKGNDDITAFDVTVNKLQDMGLDVSGIDGSTLKQVATQVEGLFPNDFRCIGRLYEEIAENGNSNYRARFFTAIK